MQNMITHNFSINSILEEKNEDKSIIKFKALVHDFKKSHNGWAMSRGEAEKAMHTLVGKHIVTRYYDESVNGGIDALGDHEESSTTLRGTDGMVEIPCTNTKSIGTITDVFIEPVSDGSDDMALWAMGQLHAWDNINEASLLEEWYRNGIKINTSVEWYYTNGALDNDNVLWVSGVTYSNLCILNSEDRGYKDIVHGNYSESHIELLLNNTNNENKDVDSINNHKEKEGEVVEEIKNEEMVTETVDVVVEETAEVVEEFPVESEVIVEEPQDETVEQVIEKEEPQVDLQAELVAAKEQEVALNEVIAQLNARITELEKYEKELSEIKYAERLANAKCEYEVKFAKFNAVDTFESEEVQSLIVDTLDVEKSLNAKLKLAEVMLNCVDVETVETKEDEEVVIVETAKSLNNLVPEPVDYVSQYGFKA